MLTVVLGVLAWAVFAFKLHGWLIGIRPWRPCSSYGICSIKRPFDGG